jgi:hypothetical protein
VRRKVEERARTGVNTARCPRAGVSDTTNVVRTARLAIRPQSSVSGRRTGLMALRAPKTGAARRGRRSGGTQRCPSRNQRETKTPRNPQNFSHEASHWRKGHATVCRQLPVSIAPAKRIATNRSDRLATGHCRKKPSACSRAAPLLAAPRTTPPASATMSPSGMDGSL